MSKEEGVNPWVASLDIENAFDTLSWPYLLSVFCKIGVGLEFMEWMKLLYSKPSARVCTGKTISDAFQTERDTRWRWPLSPIIFDWQWSHWLHCYALRA